MTDAWSENFGGSGSRFAMGGGVTRVAGEEEAVPAWDENFGSSRGSRAPVAAGPKPPDYKDPKTEGWLEWVGKNITGRVDPRFADAPAISRVLENEIYDQNSDAARSAYRNITLGQSLTPDDEAHANIVKNALGNRFIGAEKDAYGADVVRYRDKDGQEAVAYVNKPGLDMEDINNFGLQSVPYLLAARFARGLGGAPGKFGQVLAQGTSAGATSILGDAAALGYGSEKAPDPIRAGLVAGFGAGAEMLGPAAGALWRRFVTVPGLIDKTTGKLTEKGVEAATKSGFDPTDLSPDLAKKFAEEYARVGNPTVVGQNMRGDEFGLPITQGRLTKDPELLWREEAMRRGVYGAGPKEIFKDADARLKVALDESVLGDGSQSVAAAIAPTRSAKTIRPADLGENIQATLVQARDKAKGQLDDAWEKVGPMHATPEALDLLPEKISSQLRSSNVQYLMQGVDDKAQTVAPVARQMLSELRAFRKGNPQSVTDEFIGGVEAPELDALRRRLGEMVGEAKGSDRKAAGAIYQGFDDWLRDISEAALVKGDPGSYQAAATARDLTAKFKQAFTADTLQGKPTPGRQIVSKILETTDNPGSIIRELVTNNPATIPKQGSIEAIRLIKSAAEKNLPKEEAQRLVEDLGLAYWMNLSVGSTGQINSPTVIAKNINAAFYKQGEVLKSLYTPEQIGLLRRFGKAMEDQAYKDPNPSGSSYGNALWMKGIGGIVMKMLAAENGLLGKGMQMVFQSVPINSVLATPAARAAVRPTPRTANPSFGPLGAATSATIDRERNQSPRNLWQ